MSSIFSDPLWRRGSTLLGGEPIELNAAGNPVAGETDLGSVKIFTDVQPTGKGERYSARIVYCVAVRYKGSTVTDASTIAGQLYAFDAANVLGTVTSQATATNVNNGKVVGVIDEYLAGELRENDVIWVVVKGPCNMQADGAVTAGAAVHLKAGKATASTTSSASTVAIGHAISAAASNKVRVLLTSDVV
jgi:hypothetical protein